MNTLAPEKSAVEAVTAQMETLAVSKKKKKKKPPAPPPQSLFQDFAGFHSKLKAGKYKVHRPMCKCSKMIKVRKKVTTLEAIDGDDPRLDCLAVLSDTSSNSISNVFACPDTAQVSFDHDRVGTEHTVRDAIFRSTTPPPPFKVSCASCLLELEPNGFVCVESASWDALVAVRDVARATAQSLPQGLHHDHGDFVALVSHAHLLALRKAKTRAAQKTAKRAVWAELQAQGVGGGTSEEQECWDQLNLNHHVVAALDLRMKERASSSDSTVYWFVLGYTADWGLELPGGKRHLGETAWECAMRETEEETSLVIGDDWKYKKRLTEEFNTYFVLDPQDRGRTE